MWIGLGQISPRGEQTSVGCSVSVDRLVFRSGWCDNDAETKRHLDHAKWALMPHCHAHWLVVVGMVVQQQQQGRRWRGDSDRPLSFQPRGLKMLPPPAGITLKLLRWLNFRTPAIADVQSGTSHLLLKRKTNRRLGMTGSLDVVVKGTVCQSSVCLPHIAKAKILFHSWKSGRRRKGYGVSVFRLPSTHC